MSTNLNTIGLLSCSSFNLCWKTVNAIWLAVMNISANVFRYSSSIVLGAYLLLLMPLETLHLNAITFTVMYSTKRRLFPLQ